MSRYSGSKSSPSSKGSGQFWAGILVGIIIGAGMAAVFTWYRMKSPSPYLKELPVAEPLKLPTIPESLSSSVPVTGENGKPRFEFYNVLTDKPGGKGASTAKPAEKAKTTESKPAETKPLESKPALVFTPQILQIGSFSTEVDAEKLKAKLALVGAEAHIQTASIPDKGVYYRVRLGPYNTEEEMNRMRSFLKQNDVDSTPMRAQ